MLEDMGGLEKKNLDGVNFGSPISQCPTCKRVFSRPSNFDKHRSNGKCLHPSDCKMVLNAKGIWVGENTGYVHGQPT